MFSIKLLRELSFCTLVVIFITILIIFGVYLASPEEKIEPHEEEQEWATFFEDEDRSVWADSQIVSRKITPTNEIVIKLKHGGDPHQIAQKHGLRLQKCVTLSKSLCILEAPPSMTKKGLDPLISRQLRRHESVDWAEEQFERHYAKFEIPRGEDFSPNPLWNLSWHLNNTFPGYEGEDINILPAWNAGWSGMGINIGIIDDSVEWQHPDLFLAYTPETSWDFNDNDPDPSPKRPTDIHGTPVAGVALARNNSVCSLGSAFNSKMSAFRLLSGGISDVKIAQALTYSNKIHIFSNSWGFPSPFASFLSKTIKQAFLDGVQFGRDNKGFIYTWAAGNIRSDYGNSNYDSLVNSPETIGVAAVTYQGIYANYSCPGASILISAPSSGSNQSIATTDRTGPAGFSDDECTHAFGGTSSACPLVAGIIALMLEANPNLGWRDVQWILVKTARKNDPLNPDWQRNGAEYWVNHNYGFGVVDASRAVQTSLTWINVPMRTSIVQNATISSGSIPDDGSEFSYDFTVDENLITESVQLSISMTHQQIQGVKIQLVSPGGTISRLLELNAPLKTSQLDWTFMSVFNWGEYATGEWTLNVLDEFPNDNLTGEVFEAELTIWGHPVPLRLTTAYQNYCQNLGVDFLWSDPIANLLNLSSPSDASLSQSIDVTGVTTIRQILLPGFWIVTLSMAGDAAALANQTIMLNNCTGPAVGVQVLGCENIAIFFTQAPKHSSVILQESSGIAVLVNQSLSQGTGSILFRRPFYGTWEAVLFQSSSPIATSNQFTGELCVAPTLEMGVNDECSSPRVITIAANNTRRGMVLSAQSLTNISATYSIITTNTSEPLVLQIQGDSLEGAWLSSVSYANTAYVQQTFNVLPCQSPEIWVNSTSACQKGVSVNWKNAPGGSMVAILPHSTILISASASTNGENGSYTFLLENGTYQAVLLTNGFLQIASSSFFQVNCSSEVPILLLSVTQITRSSATFLWNSLSRFGMNIYDFAWSTDKNNWEDTTVYFQTTLLVVGLQASTTYYARVRGFDENGGSDWSPVITFQTTS